MAKVTTSANQTTVADLISFWMEKLRVIEVDIRTCLLDPEHVNIESKDMVDLSIRRREAIARIFHIKNHYQEYARERL